MKKILDLLLHQYPLIIAQSYLSEILKPNETKKFLKLGIFQETKPITIIPCSECGYGNNILFDKNNKPYYVCSCENGGRVPLDENDIKRYELKPEQLIRFLLAKDASNIRTQSDKLWMVGEKKVQKQKFTIYFYIGNDTNIIKKLPVLSPYSIVLYFGNTHINDNSVIFISIFSTLRNDAIIDFSIIESYISPNLRFIEFKDDGRVLLYKKEVISIAYPSPQYFFFEYLYKNYDQWKTNEEIYKYIQTETKNRTGDGYRLSNPDDCSKSLVKEIKRIAFDKKAVTTIIQNNKKTGYRISNPR